MKDREGRWRTVIEGVKPEIDGGRFAIKRTVNEEVVVEADIFTDGHDALSAVLLYRRESEPQWTEVSMEFLINDRWRGSFRVTELGRYRYTLIGWVDHFKTWRRDLAKKVEAGQDVLVDLLVGARLIEEAGRRASKAEGQVLRKWAEGLRAAAKSQSARIRLALSNEVAALMEKHPDRRFATTYEKELAVIVDREKARFSSWYEMFPRSCVSEPGRHGTLKDCEARLPYIASMGFDVLYFPPIHPIGHTHRKGKNGVPSGTPTDPGSPWGIGSQEGGHTAIHPQLGTLNDFRRFLDKAKEHGLEVALDVAFHCSPDHPYVKEHREWFKIRPDGTVQYAENPPKKYQDIYPLDFETEQWQELWEELKRVVLFWIDQGVRIFRVDNPHTKPFPFWEWLIQEVKQDHPDVIFLSEAFTRPKVMYRLTKLGFTQSYTYFAWRNTKAELIQYFTELTQTEVREYFRPNLWPNTPDILTEQLQHGGRPAFMARLVLAATLGASYGIYGPAFELCENRPREAGSEEYLDSEKYQYRPRDWSQPSLAPYLTRLNEIRRAHPALHWLRNLRFHLVDSPDVIAFSKRAGEDAVLVVCNLDPHHSHDTFVHLWMPALGLDWDARAFNVRDELTGQTWTWHGTSNWLRLDPAVEPAHVLHVRPR